MAEAKPLSINQAKLNSKLENLERALRVSVVPVEPSSASPSPCPASPVPPPHPLSAPSPLPPPPPRHPSQPLTPPVINTSALNVSVPRAPLSARGQRSLIPVMPVAPSSGRQVNPDNSACPLPKPPPAVGEGSLEGHYPSPTVPPPMPASPPQTDANKESVIEDLVQVYMSDAAPPPPIGTKSGGRAYSGSSWENVSADNLRRESAAGGASARPKIVMVDVAKNGHNKPGIATENGSAEGGAPSAEVLAKRHRKISAIEKKLGLFCTATQCGGKLTFTQIRTAFEIPTQENVYLSIQVGDSKVRTKPHQTTFRGSTTIVWKEPLALQVGNIDSDVITFSLKASRLLQRNELLGKVAEFPVRDIPVEGSTCQLMNLDVGVGTVHAQLTYSREEIVKPPKSPSNSPSHSPKIKPLAW